MQDKTKYNSTNLIRIKSPKLELLLEQRTANISRIMQFACSIVVEYLAKHTWMSIEKVLAHDRVIIGQSFSEPRQASGWNLLECSLTITNKVNNTQLIGFMSQHNHESEEEADEGSK